MEKHTDKTSVDRCESHIPKVQVYVLRSNKPRRISVEHVFLRMPALRQYSSVTVYGQDGG